MKYSSKYGDVAAYIDDLNGCCGVDVFSEVRFYPKDRSLEGRKKLYGWFLAQLKKGRLVDKDGDAFSVNNTIMFSDAVRSKRYLLTGGSNTALDYNKELVSFTWRDWGAEIVCGSVYEMFTLFPEAAETLGPVRNKNSGRNIQVWTMIKRRGRRSGKQAVTS